MSAQRVLKRTLSATGSASGGSPPKKAKQSMLLARTQLPFETPHATELSLSQTFRLPSSKATDTSPPNSILAKNKKSSSDVSLGWKENATAGRRPRAKKTYRSRNKSRVGQNTVLESPFATDSSSSGGPSSPTAEPSASKKRHNLQKRTLSDTGFLQNLPAVPSLSTNTSPVKMAEDRNVPPLHRRPSEPVMSHPALHTFQFPALSSSIPHDSSAYMDSIISLSNVDFNRPPSQLSMYDYNLSSGAHGGKEDFQVNIDGFFADIQQTSTPFTRRERPQSIYPSMNVDSDEELEDSIFSSKEYVGVLTSRDASGLMSLDERSSWIEDSLISPPRRTQTARNAALDIDPVEYDVEMGDVTRRLQGLKVPAVTELEDLHHSSLTRARSLDSYNVADAEHTSKDEDRIPATARRTRSGTITAAAAAASDKALNSSSSFRRTRSGTVVSNSANANGSTLMSSPVISTKEPRARNSTIVPAGRGTRARNGTIVAASAPSLDTVVATESSSPDQLDVRDDGHLASRTTRKTTRSVVQKVMGRAIGKWKARAEASNQRQHDEITSDDELDLFRS